MAAYNGYQNYDNYGNQNGYHAPQVGATFVPGGGDDYYMPELVSPAPQRSDAVVPEAEDIY